MFCIICVGAVSFIRLELQSVLLTDSWPVMCTEQMTLWFNFWVSAILQLRNRWNRLSWIMQSINNQAPLIVRHWMWCPGYRWMTQPLPSEARNPRVCPHMCWEFYRVLWCPGSLLKITAEETHQMIMLCGQSLLNKLVGFCSSYFYLN